MGATIRDVARLAGVSRGTVSRVLNNQPRVDPQTRVRVLQAEANALYERFNNAFWWESEGTYYLGLDGQKRPIESVASNAGHCLASGIVPPDRAARVVERLMAPDMWSGWGIRRFRPTMPRTTRSATTPARSGPTTMR